MKSHIDLPMLANWVSMLRAEIDGAIWLSDDEQDGRFYEMCAHPSSRVVPSSGVASQLLTHVKKRGVKGLVATISVPDNVDDSLTEDIFWPSLGNVASLLLASASCERTLKEITGAPWYKSAEKEVGSLRDRAISIAWIFQHILQFNSLQSGLFSIEDFIDWEILDFSETAVKANFGEEAKRHIQMLRTRLSGMIREEKLRECNGINVVKVLARATKMYHPRGLVANKVVDMNSILQMLRLSYDFSDFEADPMYWRMRRWERQNSKFPLLRQWRLLDPLLVVQDQRYWEKHLKLMIQMDSGGEGLSAFKMDLDNFKAVNEQLGHTSGDEAIRLYCRIVRDIFLETAEVYRRGGDEVVALAPGLRQSMALDLAEEIRSKIETEFLKWGSERGLSQCPTASIGVVDIEPGSVYENIVQLMDQAQLKAKTGGKNRVVLVHCKASSSTASNHEAFKSFELI